MVYKMKEVELRNRHESKQKGDESKQKQHHDRNSKVHVKKSSFVPITLQQRTNFIGLGKVKKWCIVASCFFAVIFIILHCRKEFNNIAAGLIVLFTFFVILPLSLLFIESIKPCNGVLERCIAASFLLAIAMKFTPLVLSKFISIAIVMVCGLVSHTAELSYPSRTTPQTGDRKKLKDGNGEINPDEEDALSPLLNLPSVSQDQSSQKVPKPYWKKLNPKARAFLAFIILIVIMMFENFFIWVISSTYEPSHQPPYPEPLQDNGRLLLDFLFQEKYHLTPKSIQSIRDLINIQWALMSSCGTTLLLLDLGLGLPQSQTIWSVATQTVLTLASVRLLRTLSFSLTVLPSQMKNCYVRRFSLPVPKLWSREWVREGLIPKTKGGCNDLIISGHATVTSVCGCMVTSVISRNGERYGRGKSWSSWAIWTLLTVDFAIEIYQGFHYSVDMLLGMVLTRLIFEVFRDFGLEDDHLSVEGGRLASISFQSLFASKPRDWIQFGLPAVLSFWVVVFSTWNANIFVVLFVAASTIAFRSKEENYAKYLALCLLFIAVITYL